MCEFEGAACSTAELRYGTDAGPSLHCGTDMAGAPAVAGEVASCSSVQSAIPLCLESAVRCGWRPPDVAGTMAYISRVSSAAEQ